MKCESCLTQLNKLRSRSLAELTRQITPPTKNGHAPPHVEARKRCQSANPCYVWNLASFPVLSKMNPQAPLLAVPFRRCLSKVSALHRQRRRHKTAQHDETTQRHSTQYPPHTTTCKNEQTNKHKRTTTDNNKQQTTEPAGLEVAKHACDAQNQSRIAAPFTVAVLPSSPVRKAAADHLM